MDSVVMFQIFFGCEALPTVLTHEWLFSCVASPVVRQHVILGKSGITEVTGERFLSGMDPLMRLER